MDDTSAIQSTTQPTAAVTGGAAAGAANGFGAMGSDQFVKIMFAELGRQDPLAPSDSKALLEQLSTIRSIQSSIDLGKRLESLVAQDELSAASGLMGKTVSGVSQASRRVSGEVASVSRTSAGAVLNLKSGERLDMKNVDEVLSPAAKGVAA